jgi:flagellar basal body-associated protein FliL
MSQVNVNPGNTPQSSSSGGSSAVLIVALIAIVLLLVLAYFVLWPMLSAQPQAPNVNVNVRSSDLLEGVLAYFA